MSLLQMQNLHHNRSTNHMDRHPPLHPPPPYLRHILHPPHPPPHPTHPINPPLLSKLPQHRGHPQFLRLPLLNRPHIHLPILILRSNHHKEATTRHIPVRAAMHSHLPPTRRIPPFNHNTPRHMARIYCTLREPRSVRGEVHAPRSGVARPRHSRELH